MAITYGDHPLSQIADANANTEWGTTDAEFGSIITTTVACMASGDISITEAGDTSYLFSDYTLKGLVF